MFSSAQTFIKNKGLNLNLSLRDKDIDIKALISYFAPNSLLFAKLNLITNKLEQAIVQFHFCFCDGLA